MLAPMKAELFRNKVKYFRKHHGLLAAQVLDLIFDASIFTKRMLYQAGGNKGRGDLSERDLEILSPITAGTDKGKLNGSLWKRRRGK